MQIVTADTLKKTWSGAPVGVSSVIETFEGDWEKEWFTYKPAEWGRRTHKVYDPQWAAPDGAKLSLDIQTEKANKLVVGIDHYAAEIELTGGADWQAVTLAASDFNDAEEQAMSGWSGIKELRLLAAEHLRTQKRGEKKTRLVGGHWKGEPPRFRNLRWVAKGE